MILNQFKSAAILLILSVAAGAQGSGTQRLTLREALAIAREHSYQVLIARSQVEQARGQNIESLSGFLPHVALAENYIRSNDPVTVFSLKLKQGVFSQQDFALSTLNSPDAFENFTTSVQVRQPLLNLDAIYGKSAAKMGLRARKASARHVWQSVALQVRKAYFGLILARESLSAVEEAANSTRAHREDAKAAWREGLINQADYLAAEVRVAELQENVIAARNQVANAGDGLKFALGLENDAVLVPADSLGMPATRPEPLETAPAETRRSDLLALRYQGLAANRLLRMQRSTWLPRLNAFGSVEWNAADAFSNDASNWAVGLQLQWSLFDGMGKIGKMKQAVARKNERSIQYKQASARAALEVRQANRSLRSARERLLVARTAVAQAEQSLRIVEARFKEGLEKTSDLLDREVALTNARLRLLRAQHDVHVATAEVDFALGGSSNLAKVGENK